MLPRIILSARFRYRADHESKRFLRRVQEMRWRDLRALLLAGHADVVGAAICIPYEPMGACRDVTVRFAPPCALTWNTAVTPVCTRLAPVIEIRRLRCDIYLRHAGDLLGRQVGDRPFRTETDAELAMTCRDGIPPHALQSACGRAGDEALLRCELAARFARAEIETRRGESNHARFARLTTRAIVA